MSLKSEFQFVRSAGSSWTFSVKRRVGWRIAWTMLWTTIRAYLDGSATITFEMGSDE